MFEGMFSDVFYDVYLVLILVYVFWNIMTFFLMGLDKFKSTRGHWRISEASLLTYAFLFGGIGSWVGSYVFRHKSRKAKFRVLLPLSVVVNLVEVYLILRYLII